MVHSHKVYLRIGSLGHSLQKSKAKQNKTKLFALIIKHSCIGYCRLCNTQFIRTLGNFNNQVKIKKRDRVRSKWNFALERNKLAQT